MLIEATLRRLARKMRSIGHDRRGNVAIIFALSLLPIIGLIGSGIDYGHAISVRVALQAGLDSTALMLSKKATSLTSGQLQTMAQNYFNALFNRPEAQNVSITATYTTTGGSQVVVNGSANVSTYFMGIMGFHTLNVTGQATAKWGFSRLRVALVLDNTGSMAESGKIDALKTATNADADDCGVRKPASFYMDDLDYLAQRLKELRADREAVWAGQRDDE